MDRTVFITCASALVLVAAIAAPTAAAAGPTPCLDAAQRLFVACNSDAREEYNVAWAICKNIADASDRRDCIDEAAAVKAEEKESCADVLAARNEVCDLLDEYRYDPDPLVDPAIAFIDPDDVGDTEPVNPWVSIEAGHTYVLRAGEEGQETVVVHVTGDVREINGVACRVVVDAVVEVEEDEADAVEYVPIEVTDDWFAQDTDANVYYCGELSRNYEDGLLVDLDGSFESGRDMAKGGVLIFAEPEVGSSHRQEFALDEAEDVVTYVDLAGVPTAEMGGENDSFPCAPGGCLQTLDRAAIEPESTEFKFYREGVGFVLAVAMEDGEITGEREELVCVGDSLAILEDPACGIDDPEALLDALCRLSPDAFCD